MASPTLADGGGVRKADQPVGAVRHPPAIRTRRAVQIEARAAARWLRATGGVGPAMVPVHPLDLTTCLALVSDLNDDERHGHTERVAIIATMLAERIGLPAETVALIRRAAPLHDIGKLGIADAILLKPGPLDDEEWELMKTHSALGASMLSRRGSPVLKMAREIAQHHHERWAGGGYPAGLRGDAIPLSGRLVAVADVFDALTHVRPYKAAWTVPEALEEMRRMAGVHLDPVIVERFAEIESSALPR